jgi:hypothetical protein
MAKTEPRTEKKYSIPRNTAVPDTPLVEIIASGALFKSPTGSAQGIAVPLFRAPPGVPTFSMDKRGVLYYFQRGVFFSYDGNRSGTSLALEAASIGASFFILPGVAELAGWGSKLVEKGGEMAIDTLKETGRERKRQARTTVGDQIKTLEALGVVVLPGVNIVEVEYQSEPGGFLSREQHRMILTYQGLDGASMRYQLGASMKGDKSERITTSITTQIHRSLTERMWGEVGYFTQKVRAEFAGDFAATQAEMQADFEKRFGEGSAVTNPKFAEEVDAAYNAEVERKGFTPVKCAERMLELFSPVAESYEGVPALGVIMPNLRAVAAGRTS